MKRWTMPDGKTRNAGEGPWITRTDLQPFLAFCREHGHKTREHTDLWREGHQIRHQGHWMSLLWNKAFVRYTADRRLSLLVQSFSASKATGQKGDAA